MSWKVTDHTTQVVNVASLHITVRTSFLMRENIGLVEQEQAFSPLFVDIVSSIHIAHLHLDIFKDFELYSPL